jgi:hypothetical protein
VAEVDSQAAVQNATGTYKIDQVHPDDGGTWIYKKKKTLARLMRIQFKDPSSVNPPPIGRASQAVVTIHSEPFRAHNESEGVNGSSRPPSM